MVERIGVRIKCKNCGNTMIIDEWNGWVWHCFICDTFWRVATDEEIEEYEKKKGGLNMSEMEYHNGTLQEIKFPENVRTLQEKVQFLIDNNDIEMINFDEEEWIEGSYFECENIHNYQDRFFFVKDVYTTDEKCIGDRKENGDIDYTLSFYNGGCGFSEALDKAIINAEKIKEGLNYE